ncbi:MAG TPA: hypothetical protein VIR33_03630 [Thermopolyspora sp.]
MREPLARRRVATRVAIGVIGGGILFGAIPAMAALVSKDVTYSCGSPSSQFKFGIEMAGPAANPTPHATVVVTWKIAQPSNGAPQLTAAAPIPSVGQVVIEGHAVASGSPVPSGTVTASASAAPTADVSMGSPVPLPTMLVTVVPTTTGMVNVRPDEFVVKVGSTAAGAPPVALYTCTPAVPAEVTAAQAVFTVATGASSSSPTSPTPTTTRTTTAPTFSTPTSRTTHTVFKTVTQKPKKTSKVDKTPDGGAATGGGGEAGPDGRVLVGAGSIMILGSAIGGVALRRRRLAQG